MPDTDPPDAPPPPERFADALGKLFESKISRIADLLGALGLYGLVYSVLSLWDDATGKVFGIPIGWATAIIGTFLVCIAGLLFLTWLARERHGAFIRQHRIALKLAKVPGYARTRYLQQQASQALTSVYGYCLTEVRHTTIVMPAKQGGEHSTSSAITFKAENRAIRYWARRIGSSAAPQMGCVDKSWKVSQGSVHCEKKIVGHFATEVFTFQPSIQASASPTTLEFVCKHDPKTFSVRKQAATDRDTDWVSFSPNEPIERLTLCVEFHGDDLPTDFEAAVTYGHGDRELFQEVLDAESTIVENQTTGIKKTVTMTVLYPVMGASYKLVWTKLPPP